MEEISSQDIRWKQRFQNYEKAFKRLSRAIEVVKSAPDDDLLQSGLVQTYEYTFELAWKTLKDYSHVRMVLRCVPPVKRFVRLPEWIYHEWQKIGCRHWPTVI